MNGPDWIYDSAARDHYYYDPVRRQRVWFSSTRGLTPGGRQPAAQDATAQGTRFTDTTPRSSNLTLRGEASTARVQSSHDRSHYPTDRYPEDAAYSTGRRGSAHLPPGLPVANSLFSAAASDANPNASSYAKLDSRYRQRPLKDNYFKKFRVFKAYWPEPAGTGRRPVDTHGEVHGEGVAVDQTYGEEIFCKIRWFAVLLTFPLHCICVSIVTYQGQGVGKHGVVKSHHSPAIRPNTTPVLAPGEYPRGDEPGMRTAIGIQPDEPGDQLRLMSRIDYSRIYTVDKRVKVMNFGYVHPHYEADFEANFRNVWFGRPDGDENDEDEASSSDDDSDDDDEQQKPRPLDKGKGPATSRPNPPPFEARDVGYYTRPPNNTQPSGPGSTSLPMHYRPPQSNQQAGQQREPASQQPLPQGSQRRADSRDRRRGSTSKSNRDQKGTRGVR